MKTMNVVSNADVARHTPTCRAARPGRSAGRRVSWGLRAVMVVLAVLGAYSFYRGVASLGQRKASPSRSVVAVKALSQIVVGERVVGRNPLRHEVDASEPDPATWRKIGLQMRKPSGHRLWIELLRPQVWLERYEVRPGATIFLDLHEMGAMGDADVTSVSPCPAIQPGDGPVVTGTFKHEADENNPTVRLLVEGANQATGVTANHPYWSVDRQTFIPAGDLTPGERVDTESGPRKIVSVTPVSYTGFLYNLETTEHVFRVGEIGTLVHNSYAPSKLAVKAAVEEGALKVVSHRSAVIKAASNADHHIFTKARSGWFKSRYEIEVDDFVVNVDDLTHQALHAGKSPLNNKAGWWDHELSTRISDAEAIFGRKLTRDEVLGIGQDLLKRFGLDHLPIHRYKD